MAMHGDHRRHHRRWCLPHRDYAGTTHTITYRLADALADETADASESLIDGRLRLERRLDHGAGSCWIVDPRAAALVVDTWRHFDGDRYDLIAWVVTPNHVHVIIEQRPGHPLARIVESWKSYTAKAIKRIIARKGRVWQSDYWDRYIRDEAHLADAIAYVHGNPVRARLVKNACDWPFSSAARAIERPGRPLPRAADWPRDAAHRPPTPPDLR